MGMRTASYTCQTMRTASGKSAGPDMPARDCCARMRLSRRLRSRRIAHHGVDEADAVRACVLAGLGNVCNARDVGRELDDDGLFDGVFDRARDRRGGFAGSVPKLMPPPWTLGHEMFTSSQPTCGQRVELCWQTSTYSSTRKAADVRHDGLVENARAAWGSSLGDDRVYAGILKSHGVEHAALPFQRCAAGDCRDAARASCP